MSNKYIKLRLSEVLEERGITQKELAQLTGIRPNAISEMCRDMRTTYNKEHLNTIINALDIDDLSVLFTLEQD